MDSLGIIEQARNDAVVLAAYLGYETPEHHRRWYDAYRTNENLQVLSPANHGKTTLFGLIVPLSEILKNRNIRIGYITANATIAESVLRGISRTLTSREWIQSFGDLKPRKASRWTISEIEVERDKNLKDATVFCGGLWAAIINRRFDLVICDDICDDDNMHTLESRNRVKQRFYEVILPCVEPGGRIVVIGTRQHYDDIYSELIQNSLWKTIHERAIGYSGESLWPERWPRASLERKRQEVGEIAFAKRYMNLINPEGIANFSMEWMTNCQDEMIKLCSEKGDLPKHLEGARIVQAVDVAASSSSRASAFAHITCAVETLESGVRITLLNLYRGHLAYPQQKDFIVGRYKAWEPSIVLVESNGVQQLILQDLGAQYRFLPLQPTYTGRDKASLDGGIPYLASFVKNGLLRIPWNDETSRRISGMLVDEMLAYPKGRYDDLMMALWFVVKHTRFQGETRPWQENFNKVCPRRHYPLRRLVPRRIYAQYGGNRFALPIRNN